MRPLNVNARLFFQKHCILIAVLIALLVLALFMTLGVATKENRNEKVDWLAAIVAAAAALLSLNQHAIEHDRARRKLFSSYNKRYNKMNEGLNEILAQSKQSTSAELRTEQKDKLFDYFNLCAEEYLSYSDGYVDERVWKAWCNGLLYYVDTDHRICTLFQKETEPECANISYYGLCMDVIRKNTQKQR